VDAPVINQTLSCFGIAVEFVIQEQTLPTPFAMQAFAFLRDLRVSPLRPPR